MLHNYNTEEVLQGLIISINLLLCQNSKIPIFINLKALHKLKILYELHLRVPRCSTSFKITQGDPGMLNHL